MAGKKAADNVGAANSHGGVTIHLSDISKFYSGVAALRDVSLEFYAGEVHAVLGENGAGKSTLMNVISGTIQPEQGEILFEGRKIDKMTPELAKSLGISISFQHPAVLEDLSVLENLQVALPAQVLTETSPQKILEAVGLTVSLRSRTASLTVAEKHLLEIAKALAIKPKVLILDEPTAPLDQEATDMLFGLIRGVVAKGTSVIYITHRLAEIRQIAQRVSVLRDGKYRGTSSVKDVTDADLVALIVGRSLGTAFPPKLAAPPDSSVFSVRDLTGKGFRDIGFTVGKGEIIGVAGVAGNGQHELMKALAGLVSSQGTVTLNGTTLRSGDLLRNVAFMPSDRHTEGLAAGLTVRENAAFGALEKFASGWILSWKREFEKVTATFGQLAVKAPSIEAPILSLSGGNQQKVVMSRALLSQPNIIVADEPTQGVDVGARAEIYKILREVSSSGKTVIVNSSDAAELEGLCDKVIVMSRGRVAETLTGQDVTEAKIVAAAVSASHHGEGGLQANKQSGWKYFAQTDNAPVPALILVTILLALFVNSRNENFIASSNIYDILLSATAIGFIALGQTVALLMAGIDLSVGPLAGILVVIASFFIDNEHSTGGILLGFLLMFGCALLVGLVNGILIRFANFTAIAATMAMYMGLGGVAFLLRIQPGGSINTPISDWINYNSVGDTLHLDWPILKALPVVFVLLALVTFAAEYVLRKRAAGWFHRAIGSDEENARRIGIRINYRFLLGYVTCSLFAAIGAVMLMAQWGTGDPRQGASYTLSSITAVVLGGTALTGGRGSFIGTVLGAVLLSAVLKAVVFLDLTQTYQFVFQGGLVIIAALIYSLVRARAEA